MAVFYINTYSNLLCKFIYTIPYRWGLYVHTLCIYVCVLTGLLAADRPVYICMFVCARPVGSEELWQLKYLGFFSRPAIFAPSTCVSAQHNLLLPRSVRGPRNLHLPPIEKSWWAGELEAMAWQLAQESSPFVSNTWWDTSIEVNNFPMLFFFFFFGFRSAIHV